MGERDWVVQPTPDDPGSCWVARGAMASLDLAEWWTLVDRSEGGWRQNDIRVFGQWHKEPRLTAWWGPSYRYASVHWPEQALAGDLLELSTRVGRLAGFDYNAVLVNGYRNGQDAMGWHRDNEPEIDTRSIASLSLGATRAFAIRDRRTRQTVRVNLEHGDVLVMEQLQTHHEHSVPRRTRVSEPRMNFTFRKVG